MSANKNICLLGYIDKEIETKIKSLITASETDITFNWVAANDKKLDGVVINSNYLEAPQIQKYISMVNAPIVCTHSDNENAQLAFKYQRHSINPSITNTNFSDWIATLLGKSTTPPTEPNLAVAPAKESITSTSQSTTHPIKNSSQKSEPALHNVKVADNAQKDSNGNFLNRIQKKENCVLCAVNGDRVTWVKPAEGVVFINYPRENVPGYDEWLWAESQADDIPAAARQLKLDLWMFETLWQSQLDGSSHIDDNAHFRLLRWPQPLSRQGRTEALRLAACAQGYPVDVQTLNKKTNYSMDRIYRFLFATITAGQTEQIKGVVNVKPVSTPTFDEEQRAERRSLLSRLRQRLGL